MTEAMCPKIPEGRVLRASSADDYEQWDALVSGSPTPDTYFRPGYALACELKDTSAIAAVIYTSKGRFLVPLLLRPLSMLPFGTGALDYDAVSPYGYGGLLPLDSENISEEDAVEFIDVFRRWCLQERIVSCMVRLHPLMEQSAGLSGAALGNAGIELRAHGATEVINLRAWDRNREAPAGMNKGRRSDLSLARRTLTVKVVSCGVSDAPATMNVFRKLYDEAMERIGASSHCLFSEKYYLDLTRGIGHNMAVAVAMHGEDAVGGALFFADGRFGHYHLSGTGVEGRQYKANTLVLVAGADWARQHGCDLLHLGGGLTPDDSLYQFKRSFGGSTASYSFMTVIANRVRYDELVELRNAHADLGPLREGFFPEYRG
jgi:Acetyltransferase (GNAT) domain